VKLIKTENPHLGETMYIGEHKSGLGVFVIPKKGFCKKYAVIGTRYGSIDSEFIPKGGNEAIKVPDGIAHFLEHKLFEQPDGSNAFDKFSDYGANANAFTSFNTTCYLFACTENFNECFEHLLSYVQEPYFTDENVEKEQGIIGQEIRMYDDDPDWRVQFNLLKALYKNTPVNTDISGTVESISKIDKDILYTCYETFYNMSNMAVCVAGDVDPDEVAAIVEKAIVKEGFGKAVSVYPDEPDGAYKKEIKSSLEVSIPLFDMGYKDNQTHDGDDILKNEIAMKIITKVIAGDSSDLYNELYEEGLINASFDTDVMCAPQYSCAIFGGESENPEEVCERIRKRVEEYTKKGICAEEFERVRRSILGSFARSFNDVGSIGRMVLKNVLYGVNTFKFHEIYDTVTLEYVNERLADIFKEENRAVSIVC